MYSLDSNFGGSDTWSHMPTWPCPRFLPPFWQCLRCLDSEVSVPTYPRSCNFHLMSVPICPMSIYRLLPPGRSCKPGWLHSLSQWGDSHALCFFIGRQSEPFLHQGLSFSSMLPLHWTWPSDPLVNCLCLQRLRRGITRVQGPASPRHLSITVDHLKVIQCSLDLSTRDHVMYIVSLFNPL